MNIKHIFHLLFHNSAGFLMGILSRVPWIVSDKTYVRLQYKANLGEFPDLKHPQTYTEKLQWLKLYDHNPLYTKIVDKVTAKEYIKNILGEEYLIPTLGVWNNPDEIDFEKLPEKFVLKCNHTGGGAVFICKNKQNFNFESVKKQLNKQLKMSTFLKTREWPYKNIERKVFCEQYVEDDSGELRDYKFYCFNGEVKLMLIASNRFSGHNFNYYDMDFNPLAIDCASGRRSLDELKKPEAFEEMKNIASQLSKGFPHVRVDLYYINKKIYFGELTFYDASGFDDMNSDEWNKRMGSWIDLSLVQK